MGRNLFGGGFVGRGKASRSSPFGRGTLGAPASSGASIPTPDPFLVVDFANGTQSLNGAPISMEDMHAGRSFSPAIAANTVPGVGLKSVITDTEFSQNSTTVRFNDTIQAIFEQGFVFFVDFEQHIDGAPAETDYAQLSMTCYAGPDVDGYYAFGHQTGAGTYVLSAFPPEYETAEAYEIAATDGVPHKLAIRRLAGSTHIGSLDGDALALGALANDAILPQDWFFNIFSDCYTPDVTITQIIRSIAFYPPEAVSSLYALTD